MHTDLHSVADGGIILHTHNVRSVLYYVVIAVVIVVIAIVVLIECDVVYIVDGVHAQYIQYGIESNRKIYSVHQLS